MKTNGKIIVIFGPMFAGKSDELIKRYERLISIDNVNPKEIIITKPKSDIRSNKITSRTGKELDCHLINEPKEILKLINSKIKYVFIDEFQFFNDSLIKVVKELKTKGITVNLSGLNKNFKKIDFPIYARLIDIADYLINITARCAECGNVAKYSKKLVNGEPAKRKSDTIEIDVNKNVTYLAVCSKCHR